MDQQQEQQSQNKKTSNQDLQRNNNRTLSENKSIAQNDPKKQGGFKEVLSNILEHNSYTIIMTIITIYALFGDDFRILTTNKDGDEVFWVLNIIAMVAFSLEIVIASIVQDDYLGGFFFWLDVLSTFSLLLDIGWVSQAIFGDGGSSSATSAASLARAGRASRVGTKAGRIVRIVRLVRLVKLYKHATQALISEAEIQEGLEEQNYNSQPDKGQALQTMLQEREQKKTHQKGQSGQQDQQTNSFTQLPAIKTQPARDKNDTAPQTGENQRRPSQQCKLPPISQRSDNDGPSKPVVLDKYKNDPLLQPQGEATERKLNGQSQNTQDDKEENIARIHPAKDDEKSNKNPSHTRLPADSENKDKAADDKDKNQGVPQETKVGQKLSSLTTQRVITLVMSIMFSIPIFSSETWVDPTKSYDYGLWTIYKFKDNPTLMKEAFENYIDYHKDIRSPVIFIEFSDEQYSTLQYPGEEDDNIVDYLQLRGEEKTIFAIYENNDDSKPAIATSVMDNRSDNDLNAILSIIRTVFVSIVLSAGAMFFSRDVEVLVLEPIENMVNKVQRIAENPLEAAQMEEKETLLYYQLKEKKDFKQIQKKQEQEKMETVILEKLIIKIGALLAVGFGEAGSEIIAKNMRKGGDVDPMIPGQKIMAVFGFCDIRNFTDATEVLQTGVMVFVNEIAEITHGCVDEFCGQSNKNIGDAFLLVWKYSSDSYTRNQNGDVQLKNDKFIRRYSDLSVLSFVKIMAALCLSNKLVKYKKNQGLNARIPGYNKKGVRMGFGLHQGWAIEGAIGSDYKIDASYLSPNVNMASRLEAATKQFGTGLLISGPLYRACTDQLQKELRHIDRVTVKGSIEPLDLYTCDVSFENLLKYKEASYKDKYDASLLTIIQRKKKRVIDRIKRNRRKKDIDEGNAQIAKLFQTDQEIIRMRQIFPQEFFTTFEEGFNHYLEGNWGQAKEIFEQTLVMLENKYQFRDGCSNTLLEVINAHNGKAPSDWQGYRSLTEK